MTSNRAVPECFVWIWLPDASEPIVAGRLARAGEDLVFNYGRSYLSRENAIAIYDPELPLKPGTLPLLPGLSVPSCIRDAAPDAWGRRVILNTLLGRHGRDADPGEIDELTYLLASGSDRIGAIDFQESPETYVPRQARAATLDELLSGADRVEKGVPLSPDLDQALMHGSSIGGARPKALISDGDTRYIAKFSAQNDIYSVVKAEYVAMRLGAMAGLSVAPVKLARAAGKDVLLIGRFDRRPDGAGGWQRRAMVSALTLLGLEETMARYASYEELASIIRHRFARPRDTLKELFGRIVFNVLCGNTDDHVRNHAAFWDGRRLELTPAYDICPQARSGSEASQAMLIVGDQRQSRLTLCIEAAALFQLKEAEAAEIVATKTRAILENWDTVCREADLSTTDKAYFWRRHFLNPYAFEGAPREILDIVS